MQLWDNLRRCRELRSSRHRMGPLPDLPWLRQKTRSKKSITADGISRRGILEGGQVLAVSPMWPSYSFQNHLTSRLQKTCYTARRIRLFASCGFDFQEGPPDLPSPPNCLHFRQLNAEADA